MAQHPWLFAPLFALVFWLWGRTSALKIAGHGLNKPALLLTVPAARLLARLPLLGALAVTVALWLARSTPYKIWGGSLAPTRGEYVGTFARHAMGAAALALAAALTRHLQDRWAFDPRLLTLGAYPFIATALAAWVRHEHNRGRDGAPAADIGQGLALGGLFAWAVVQ